MKCCVGCDRILAILMLPLLASSLVLWPGLAMVSCTPNLQFSPLEHLAQPAGAYGRYCMAAVSTAVRFLDPFRSSSGMLIMMSSKHSKLARISMLMWGFSTALA